MYLSRILQNWLISTCLLLPTCAVHGRLAGPLTSDADGGTKVDKPGYIPRVARTPDEKAAPLQEYGRLQKTDEDNAMNDLQAYFRERRFATESTDSAYEEERSDEKFLEIFKDSVEHLCANTSSPAKGAVSRYSVPVEREPSGQNEGEMVAIDGGAVLSYSTSRDAPVLGVPCQQDVQLEARIRPYTRGDVLVEPLSEAMLQQCDWTVEEDTILVLNPRDETFGGVFHNLEQVFGVLQSSDILQKPIYHFRLVFAYSSIGAGEVSFLQLNGQLDTPLAINAAFSAGAPGPKQLLAPLVDVFSHIVKGGDLLEALPVTIPAGGRLCFKRQVVLPMRPCGGEVLTRTWSPERSVHRNNALVTRYANYIRSRFSCMDEYGRAMPKPPPGVQKVLWMSRHSSHGRNVPEDVETQLLSRLRKELNQAVEVEGVDFSDLSMTEQICRIQTADLLIGVHGSGLTHMVYMPPGAGVVEITPYVVPTGVYASFSNFPMNLAKWTNHSYKTVVAKESGQHVQFHLDDVVASSKSLLDEQRERTGSRAMRMESSSAHPVARKQASIANIKHAMLV